MEIVKKILVFLVTLFTFMVAWLTLAYLLEVVLECEENVVYALVFYAFGTIWGDMYNEIKDAFNV